MSDTYTPTAVEQSSYEQPLDDDSKDVASVEVMMQGLADGLAATARIGFNWNAKITTNHQLERGAWDQLDQAWFGVGRGGSDFLEVSYDGGRSWADLNGSLGSGLSCGDVAISSTGLVSIVNIGTQTVYLGTRTAYATLTFAAHATALGAVFTDGQLEWDGVHAVFVACYRSTSAGMHVDLSLDGVSWGGASLPTPWTAYTGTTNPVIGVSALGKMVAAFYDTTAAVYHTMHSSDGGVTWIAGADLATAIGGPSKIGKVIYDPVLNYWYFCGSKTSSSRQTDLFRSADDGATWTSLLVNADTAFQDVATIAGVLIATNDDGRIFLSYDAGVTWKMVAKNNITFTTRLAMRGANGQLMVWNEFGTSTYATPRYGAVGT